jgi:protoporphyrinogen oxidase
MVMLPPEKVPTTFAGKPKNVTSVTPVVLYVISVIAVFTQTVWLSVPGAEVRVMAVLGSTVMVPVAVTFPQSPVTVTL